MKLNIVVFAMAFIHLGCGGSAEFDAVGSSSKFSDSKTGGKAIIQVPSTNKSPKYREVNYTYSGHKEEVTRLQTKLSETLSRILSRSLRSIDTKIQLVDDKPQSVTIGIELAAPFVQNFKTEAPLVEENGSYRAEGKFESKEDDTYQYYYVVNCLTKNCNTQEVLVTQEAQDKTQATAGAIIAESNPTLKVQSSRDHTDSEYQDEKLAQIIAASQVPDAIRRRTVMVVNGRSYSDVTVQNPENKQEELLKFQTDLTETNDSAALINNLTFLNSKSSKQDKPQEEYTVLQGSLVGNNPNTGSFVVDFQNTDLSENAKPENNEVVRFFVVEEPKTQEVDNRPSTSGSAIFPNPTRQDLFKSTYITEVMNELHSPNKGHVKTVIEQLQTDKGSPKDLCGNPAGYNSRKRVESFLAHAQYVSPLFTGMANKLDVTPKVANLAFIESNFFNSGVSKEYLKVQNIVSSAGAVGPFQFLYRTAKDDINKRFVEGSTYNILPSNLTHRTSKPTDDRNFLVPSFHMALEFMNQRFKESKDPALAAFSYNRGQGNRNNDQQKALDHLGVSEQDDRVRRFDVTLDDLMDYNMVRKSRHVCGAAHYAYTFVALSFITENPEAYGFEIKSIEDSKVEQLNKTLVGPQTKVSPEIQSEVQSL